MLQCDLKTFLKFTKILLVSPLNILILFTVFLFSSCSQENDQVEKEVNQVISFDFEKKTEDWKSVGLIKDVEIIPLLGADLLGNPKKILRQKELFYFLDKENQFVSIYDTTGKFINKIHDFGRGGNEYSQLVDILIDSANQQIKLLSRNDKKLLSYTLDGKKLLNISKLPKVFMNMINDNNTYWGFTANYVDGKKAKNIWKFDSLFNLKDSYIDINPGFASYSNESITPFSKFGHKRFYIQMMDNDIYSLNKDEGSVPYYRFDFGSLNWPDKINTLSKMDNMPLEDKDKYIREIEIFQETNKFIFIKVTVSGQSLLGVYNKINKTNHIVALNPYIDKYFFSFGEIISVNEKAIYTLVSANAIRKILKGKDEFNDFEATYPAQIARLREKFKGLNFDENSNPFLATYYLE